MKFLLLLVSLLPLNITVVGQEEAREQLFSPEQLSQEVLFLFENLEQIHPDLYHVTPKNQIEILKKELIDGLKKPLTRKEFALKVVPLITALKDGHTRIMLPNKERSDYLNNGGLLFPFSITIDDGNAYVVADLSTERSVAINSKIISINGVEMREILDQVRRYVSAELDHFRDINAARDFRRLYWFLYGHQKGYRLELQNGDEHSFQEVKGVTLEQFRESSAKLGSTVAKPYSYYQVENTSIGVIDFRSMSNMKQFKHFLDSTFSIVKSQNIEHLVVDIRKNGGGNSQLADMLFDYITDKPYKMTERVDIKVSKQTKRAIKQRNIKWYLYPIVYPVALFVDQARPYFYGKNGTMVSLEQKKLNKPKNMKLKFTGPTYLLTSAYTFSSANMLAAGYKCYDMGTVIGEETGGVLTAFGELTDFELPLTKLKVYASSKRFIHPCNDGELHGVMPDIEVKSSIQDKILGRDSAIEYIKKSIK